MKATKQTKAEKAEQFNRCLNHLQNTTKAGDTWFTHVGSVAASGMSLRIRVYRAILDYEGKPTIEDISYYVANVLDRNLSDAGIRIDGCGMDMGFELVYCTSAKLFQSFVGDRSGYEINQRWL